MKAEVTITIHVDETVTVDLSNQFAGAALDRAKELLDKLSATSDSFRPLVQSSAATRADTQSRPPSTREVRQAADKPRADRPPPEAVAQTNGHGPKKPARPAGSTATAKRPRRSFSDEVKAEAVAAAREAGVAKVAEQLDVLPGVVRAWIKKHPKEHAVAEPIRGTTPAVGESRDEWEIRRREAAGAAL